VNRTSHLGSIALMVGAATLWSIAGVVTRTLSPALQAGGGFEIVFWRSLFAALFVAGYLLLVERRGLTPVREAGRAGLVCGTMWCVMFSCFMFALTLTTVANVLVVMGIGPLVTALLARIVLGTPVPARTVAAITAATIGIGWMFAQDAGTGPAGRHAAGMLVALLVPLAGAVNLVTLARNGTRVDLIPAVLIGGTLSALLMLPLALPLQATAIDVGWLALLGCVQLALPCMLLVLAARRLSPPEIALIGMLELVLGPLWAWLGAGETPAPATLAGGAVVLAALFANEVAGLLGPRARRDVC
jgi:drug/metabolite transporter (DMT)-like permease